MEASGSCFREWSLCTRRRLQSEVSSTMRLKARNSIFSWRVTASFSGHTAVPGFEARLSPEGIYSNTVFLLTLIFVTPGMRLNRRGIYLGISVVLLYLVHVVFLVTKVEVSLVASRHPLAGSTFFWESADNFLEIMGKALFPILIWLLLTLYYMMGAVDAIPSRLSGKRPGRNDPCPCGSGRKYKYCCGSR